jgi:hypothetical protein
MNQMLESLADRLEAFPEEEREAALRALGQRLAEIEAAKLEALRRDLDAGIEQARNGETVDGEDMFATFKRKYGS